MTELLHWAEEYFKHKDMFTQQIAQIQKTSTQLILEKKDGKKEYVLLGDKKTLTQEHVEKTWILVPNTKESIDLVLQHWDMLAKTNTIRIVFINTKENKFWILHPETHAKIASSSKLKEGLIALQENC